MDANASVPQENPRVSAAKCRRTEIRFTVIANGYEAAKKKDFCFILVRGTRNSCLLDLRRPVAGGEEALKNFVAIKNKKLPRAGR